MPIIKNSLAHQIAYDAILGRAATEAHNKHREHHTVVQNNIQDLIKETLKIFSLEYNVDLRFTFSATWPNVGNDPHFYINYLVDVPNGKPVDLFFQDNFVNIAGQWIHIKKCPIGNRIYLNLLDLQKNLENIDLKQLEAACHRLTEKTGCRVEHTQYTIVKGDGVKIPRTHDDLLALHPASRIAAGGEKMHPKRNIKDPWAIVQTKKGNLIVYYSTNGHGFGYDTVVMPEKPVNDFYFWLDGGDKNKRMSLLPASVLKKLDVRGP